MSNEQIDLKTKSGVENFFKLWGNKYFEINSKENKFFPKLNSEEKKLFTKLNSEIPSDIKIEYVQFCLSNAASKYLKEISLKLYLQELKNKNPYIIENINNQVHGDYVQFLTDYVLTDEEKSQIRWGGIDNIEIDSWETLNIVQEQFKYLSYVDASLLYFNDGKCSGDGLNLVKKIINRLYDIALCDIEKKADVEFQNLGSDFSVSTFYTTSQYLKDFLTSKELIEFFKPKLNTILKNLTDENGVDSDTFIKNMKLLGIIVGSGFDFKDVLSGQDEVNEKISKILNNVIKKDEYSFAYQKEKWKWLEILSTEIEKSNHPMSVGNKKYIDFNRIDEQEKFLIKIIVMLKELFPENQEDIKIVKEDDFHKIIISPSIDNAKEIIDDIYNLMMSTTYESIEKDSEALCESLIMKKAIDKNVKIAKKIKKF